MEIFQNEINDGLESQLRAKGTISYASEIFPAQAGTEKLVFEAAKAGIEDVDLFYIDSILASVGWNGNDDIFDRLEVVKAKNTPINKQFNMLHDDHHIIGHIVSSVLISDNKALAEDVAEADLPASFDIKVGSVIYRRWSDEIQQELIDKTIAEIKENKWFVSMECIFPNFDYGLIGPTGDQLVIKRSEASSFLTKHLRCYGGKGVYEGYKLGRLLRNIVFSGKGLVKVPANPRSVIFTDAVAFAGLDREIETLNKNTEKLEMADTNVDKAAEYEKTIAELNLKIKTIESEKHAEADKKHTDEVAALQKSLADLKSEVDSLKAALAGKDEEVKLAKQAVDAVQTEAKAAQDELVKTKQEIATAKRVAKLVAGNVTEADAVAFVSQFNAVSDEQFETLAVLCIASKTGKPVEKTHETPDPAEIEAEAGKTGTVPSETESDKAKQLQASVASWVGAKVKTKMVKGAK